MYPFRYERPQDLAEAVRLLRVHAQARPLSGGMTLLPTLKHRLARPSHLVDLARLDGLHGIACQGGVLSVGAATPHAQVAASPVVRQAIPALAHLAGLIGDAQVRQRGTLGGSIANNDPAADYPSAVLGLGATVVTDRRRIAADDFFTGMFSTALEAGEIVTAVEFPLPLRAAYCKHRHPASGYALVGLFLAETSAGVRVALTGAAPCVLRWTEAEARLSSRPADPLAAIQQLQLAPEGLNDDLAATPAYRAHLAGVLLRRALGQLSASPTAIKD
ncbi:xanthine dehydrogenase family protein subunit M [Variovorax ureilyticus]|uniref:Xanthine dehydrogenase family protein subunit M n=1 Tax=Variovorax ureilyticus TaxID=1836198 RepID=A0ABU8VGX6_9BURK